MRPIVDFRECLKDSPKFRASLEEAEQNLDFLEVKLEKLMKLCIGMVEAGKVYNTANSSFVNGLKDVAELFHDDKLASEALSRFTQVLTELQNFQSILLDQAHRSIVKSLNHFIRGDIRKVKESRKHFEKISNDMDSALIKNSQVTRSKPHECEELNNIVTAMRSCFSHTALDYVFQMNVIHSKKNFDILDTALAYLHAQTAYFHQGFDLFTDLEPYMKHVAAQVEDLSSAAETERKEMENRHLLVQQKGLNDLQLTSSSSSGTTIKKGEESKEDEDEELRMEGYLFKRTSNTFKTWVRRWFQIENNQLVYRKRSKDNLTIMEEDLRLCTVRPTFDLDRRFCFEVVSPARTHILQADSDDDCQKWIRAIQDGVSKAYNTRRSMDDSDERIDVNRVEGENGELFLNEKMKKASSADSLSVTSRSSNTISKISSMSRVQSAILQVPGNNQCCDCNAANPSWATINLGTTLCIECSGIHRSLGVHVSKVRSITLDAWELDLVKVMTELGNAVVNQIYEANVDETIAVRAIPSSNRMLREAWIKAKYLHKSFTKPFTKPSSSSSSSAKLDLWTTTTLIRPNARRWSVCKRKRKARTTKTKDENSTLPVLETDIGEDNEKGGGGGEGRGGGLDEDVFVFGSGINNDERWNKINLSLDESDNDSGSDTEAGDADVHSTTSLEDISKLNPDLLLFKASRARNVQVMLEALALGASINWQNEEDNNRTPLIQAVISGSMTTVEFLLLNGAKVDIRDKRGQGPLHHATILGHTGQVCQLLKRNANHQLTDEDGRDALSIAMEKANADIVTLLRLARLNEEMKESEGGYGIQGDETVNDVFRDFTNMANSAPERLNRNK